MKAEDAAKKLRALASELGNEMDLLHEKIQSLHQDCKCYQEQRDKAKSYLALVDRIINKQPEHWRDIVEEQRREKTQESVLVSRVASYRLSWDREQEEQKALRAALEKAHREAAQFRELWEQSRITLIKLGAAPVASAPDVEPEKAPESPADNWRLCPVESMGVYKRDMQYHLYGMGLRTFSDVESWLGTKGQLEPTEDIHPFELEVWRGFIQCRDRYRAGMHGIGPGVGVGCVKGHRSQSLG